jgi:hypothetical protein
MLKWDGEQGVDMDLLSVGILIVIGIGVAVVGLPILAVALAYWYLALPVLLGYLAGPYGFFFGVGAVVIIVGIKESLKEDKNAKIITAIKENKKNEKITYSNQYENFLEKIVSTINGDDELENVSIEKLKDSAILEEIGITDELDVMNLIIAIEKAYPGDDLYDTGVKYEDLEDVSGVEIAVFLNDIFKKIYPNEEISKKNHKPRKKEKTIAPRKITNLDSDEDKVKKAIVSSINKSVPGIKININSINKGLLLKDIGIASDLIFIEFILNLEEKLNIIDNPSVVPVIEKYESTSDPSVIVLPEFISELNSAMNKKDN